LDARLREESRGYGVEWDGCVRHLKPIGSVDRGDANILSDFRGREFQLGAFVGIYLSWGNINSRLWDAFVLVGS
jgi:hypothetical protein